MKPCLCKIAVDIDEVLTPFALPMFAYSKKHPVSKKYPYNYAKALNISSDDSVAMVNEYYSSDDFKNSQPIYGSQYALSYIAGRGFDLYAVSGRQNLARNETEQWIETNYPYIFKDVILTNSFTNKEIKKVDICRSLAIGQIIDDNLQICMECESEHIKAINFIGDPVYPWCQENSISVKKWSEIFDMFLNI